MLSLSRGAQGSNPRRGLRQSRPRAPVCLLSCAAVAVLALSQHLSFHARGDAAFVWHGLTGDVAEMSRDVLALLLSFAPPRDEEQDPPGGLAREEAQEYAGILRARRFLVQTSGQRRPGEMSPLLAGFPRVPRGAVFERNGKGVILYTRAATALPLDEMTSRLFLRCDGERSLGQVLGDAGHAALEGLLRLARADVAALEVPAKPVSQGGVQLNAAAESTMPYPEIPDVRLYAVGGAPPQPKLEEEPTFASLFATPHPSLGGRTYAQAMAHELRRRGAFDGVPAPHQVLSLGLAMELPDARVETNIARVQQAESYRAVVVNEIGAQLGFSDGKNSGLLRLVTDAAEALAPGGVLIVADHGDPKAEATPDSISFADLLTRAGQSGLRGRVVPLWEILDLDVNAQALSTTRASFPALQALFAANGLALTRRAWLRSEIERLARGKLDFSTVHGLQWAPMSERSLSLVPKDFWALVAVKPPRTIHQRAHGT